MVFFLTHVFADEQYTARVGYEKSLPDEISFPVGALLDVMHKLLDGWWVVK